MIFENRAGATVNDIFPDEKTNKEFNKTEGNIAGFNWEAEPPEQETKEPEVYIPQIKNNQYAALEGDKNDDKNGYDQENDTKSTGVENDGEITGVRHDGKTTGVDSNDESTGIKLESVSTGATEKADEMELI